MQYRTYWPLKALGLPKQFHTEENMKAALADKNSNRYRIFIRELRAVSARDERLFNFVCESLPSDALEDIKAEISATTRSKERERHTLAESDIKGKEGGIYTCDRRKARQRGQRAYDGVRKACYDLHRRQKKKFSTDEKWVRESVAIEE